MDIRMPVLDGIEATRRIVSAQPATRVLILTTFGLDGYVYDALRAGASDFMLKDAPPEEIAAAVRIVANGEALLAPAVTRSVIEEFARRRPAPAPTPPAAVSELMAREREVLDLLARGSRTRRSARGS
jgi:DNA-binding NarL/FixJ family response regulator